MNVADERRGRWRRGGGHSCSHTVHGITHTPTHTSVQPGCSTCSGLGARMYEHLVWCTQWHTPVRVIIIITCGCLSGRVSPAAAAAAVYCHREGREEERQLGHDAMTRVVVVAAGCEHHVAWWHQQTTQHSKGKGRGGAATRTVTHPPPLSHQHKQAATSLELLARGRCCGCVKHPFLPLHQHTLAHTHTW